MFGSSNTSSSNSPKLFTGLTAFKVLGVNPSKQEIESYINKEYKLNVNYDIVEMNGRSMRPVEFWVSQVDNHMEPVAIRFLISTSDDIAQTGSVRVVNNVGSFSYTKDLDNLATNEKMNWFTKHSFRQAKVGEYELFTFMQALMRYNANGKEAQFLEDTKGNGITVENIVNNDLSGLRKFIDWCNSNGNMIVLLSCVRSTSKIVDNNERVYYNQTLCTNPDFFFRSKSGDVSADAIKKVKTAHANGDRITKYLFTAEFQPFILEECLNNVPQETVSTSTNTFNPLSLL